VFDLGLQPPANEFKKIGEPRLGFFPLSVLLCTKCTLSQLSVVIDPELLYRDYRYVTSTSVTMQRHFSRLFCDLDSELKEGALMTLVEIGSNDGECLRFAFNLGYRMLGIEPALTLQDCRNSTDTMPEQILSASSASRVGRD
jgi:hypothetical protein